MPTANEEIYSRLCDHAREIALLVSIERLLGWDERTLLPPDGAAYRADQVTYISGTIHRKQTDPRFGEWLAKLVDSPLAEDPTSDSGATIRQLKRAYDKKIKLPQALVEEIARTAVMGQQVWQQARGDNDFASFRPLLEKMYELKREEADAIGFDERRYDPLLDDYEPDARTTLVAQTLEDLREALVPLVGAIAESSRRPKLDVLRRSFRVERQAEFGRLAAEAIGFDFQRGRLDVTAHPFCMPTGPRDCRITTRYYERDLSSALFSTLHEAGHGIYEQGLPSEHFGLPLGDAVSLGIHESQSRMWENLVGRSRGFWEHFYGRLRSAFPATLGDVDLDTFYFAVNDVRPSLIRIEADEATYNLHILIRFELEQAVLDGELPVADLPGAWHEKYRRYLGIASETDADGVLQDIHWSAGLVGYFPTYSLGNLYASQFFEQADADLGGLHSQFARGDFAPLREWLGEKIHQKGQRLSADELVQEITGKPLSHEPLMRHLRAKLGPLYGLRSPA